MSNTTLFLTKQTRDDLIHKFKDDPSIQLENMWSHFCMLAQNNSFWFSAYSVLSWLVTDDELYRESAREHFLGLARNTDLGLVSDEVQTHTHTVTAPLTHTMALYDWIYGTGLLTPEEEKFFADSLLDFACQTALVQLQGRARAFDNQILANAAGAAFTGFVIGRRFGMNGKVRQLYETGHLWLIDQLGRLSNECYSLEGSTYHELIVLPLLTLSSAFIEEVDGFDVYEKGLNGGTPVRDWLITYEKMIGESGLLPGWDQYGVMRASVKLPLAYRSFRDSCPMPLAKIISADMWYPICLSTWEMVDRLWTLIWWNDSLDIPFSISQQDWMNKKTGGAIHGSNTHTRLFQYWDETPGTPHCGRPQVNPNALQLDFAGLPLLLDGAPALDLKYLNWDIPVMSEYLGTEATQKAIASAINGSIGESNSLIIDDEDWYVPLSPVRGKGRELHAAGNFKLIASDATDYYTDRYDLSKCTRNSLLIGGDYALVIDQVKSLSPHRVTWQAFTWPDTVYRDAGVVSSAADTVRLDILGLPQITTTLKKITGFPLQPCNSSTRVRMALNEKTCDTTFSICLYAQNSQQLVEDITAGWMHSKDDELSETEVDLNYFYLTDNSSTGTRHQFKRQVVCTADDLTAEMILRLNWGGPKTRLWVNGIEVLPIFEQTSAELQEKNFNFPLSFQINEKLDEGLNELCLETQNFHGESLKGPICLQREIETHNPEFVQITDKSFKVKTSAGWDDIMFSSGVSQSWLGGEIQAIAVLKQISGEISFLGVQKADIPEEKLQVSATQPFDFAIKDNNIILGRLPESLSAVIHFRGSLVKLDTLGTISIATVAKSPLCLSLDFSKETFCIVNGKHIQIDRQKMTIEVPKCITNSNLKISSLSPDSLYRYAEAPDFRLESVILAALESSDWRVKCAGVNIAGRFAMREVVPELLKIFKEEWEELPYPRLCAHWNRSKMNQALNPGVNHTPDPLLDPVLDAKRYRLRQAIIIAFGQIADPRALPALRNAMCECTDHFLALAQVPVSLARLDDRESVSLLKDKLNFREVNVHRHIELALSYLTNEISRATFESRVNP